MDETTQIHFQNIFSTDKELQNQAYDALIETTHQPVDWAYDVWDQLVESLRHKDNHVRAISAQVLCGLAKSDPEKRMLKDFDALLAVTKDERFVTARHGLQALWKVGVAGAEQRTRYVNGLEARFRECIHEKNGTLIRYDILQSLRNVYDQVKDENIREKAVALIEAEEDTQYRKKYNVLWKPSKGSPSMKHSKNKSVARMNRSMPASTVIPELAYPHVREAVEWLCRSFGFVERLRIGDHRAQLTFGEGAVIVTQAGHSATHTQDHSHAIMVRVTDVDEHYTHTQRSGVPILSEPTDYPYGERQYVVEDLGGHRWTFSQTIADIDPASWGGFLKDDA